MMEQRTQEPPIYVDMTIGDESARISKVKHQGVFETVRVMNSVLRKMNADIKLDIESVDAPLMFEIPDFPDVPEPTNGGSIREMVTVSNDT
jgi:hypothetical protein